MIKSESSWRASLSTEERMLLDIEEFMKGEIYGKKEKETQQGQEASQL